MIKIINEGRNYGTIYHFTTIEGLIGILSSNSIKADNNDYDARHNHYNYISFTRDKNLWDHSNTINNYICVRIRIDYSRLTNKYKSKPFMYADQDGKYLDRSRNNSESEERLILDKNQWKLYNISDYIIDISISIKYLKARSKILRLFWDSIRGHRSPIAMNAILGNKSYKVIFNDELIQLAKDTKRFINFAYKFIERLENIYNTRINKV